MGAGNCKRENIFLVGSGSHPEVTQLLLAWSEGQETALEKLIPLVHKELRRLAHRYMWKEREGLVVSTKDLRSPLGTAAPTFSLISREFFMPRCGVTFDENVGGALRAATGGTRRRAERVS